MSGFTEDLQNGVAAFLGAAGVGTWSPTGAYADGATAITIKDLPDSPDRALAVAAYVLADDPGESTVLYGIQVRCRGTHDLRGDDDALADAVRFALHGQQWPTLGNLTTGLITRTSSASLGADNAMRWVRTENYQAWFSQPSAALPD